ncbi:tetratricopeptide repeat protein [Thermocrinis sp.]
MKTLVFILLYISLVFAYNQYRDYFFCRYFQDREPSEALKYCVRAIQREPTPSLYVDTIRLFLTQKRLQEALSLALKFKKEYPQDQEPYLVLHSVYILRGEPEKALEALEEGYKVRPDSKQIMAFLAEEYIKMNRLQDAKRVLEELARSALDNPYPYYMLARIYLTEGLKEKAIEYLDKALQIRKTFEAGFVTLGDIYEKEKEFSKAENLYRDILKEDPENRVALERLANLYLITGRIEDAKEVYRKLIDYYQDIGYKTQYIFLLLRASEFQEAEKLAKELYLENPKDLNVSFVYGIALESNKKKREALRVYEKILEENPENIRIMERMATIYIDEREYDKARALIKKALDIAPDSYEINLLMANLLSEEEKAEEALSFVDKAINLDPKDYRGYFLKAIILDKLGKIVDAEKNLKKAIELKPEDPDLYNHLGYSLLLWYEGARVDEAEKLILKAIEKDDENPAYIDSYAWVLYYKGEYLKAYELLLKALEKEKEDPVIWEHLGDVLLKLNRKSEALEAYRKSWEMLEKGKRGEPGQRERLKEKLK